MKSLKEFCILKIALMLTFASIETSAQNNIKQILAPNAAELLRVNANEVNLFTGTPIISIPIESYEVDGYKVNVGLNYNSGGIRVLQASTNVGLGWHLSAGGSIVRNLRGLPDETIHYDQFLGSLMPKYGYIRPNEYYLSGPVTTSARNINLYDFYNFSLGTGNQPEPSDEYLLKHKPFFFQFSLSWPGYRNIKTTDNEPDIFEFNFNGKSGKFVFDNDDGIISIHQIPWMGLKIEYSVEHSQGDAAINGYYDITSFTVTDTDNTKYFFDVADRTVGFYGSAEISQGEDGSWAASGGGPTPRAYNSSWHLSKVLTPNQNTVNYGYAKDTISINYNHMHLKSKHNLTLGYPGGIFVQGQQGTGNVGIVTNRISQIYSNSFLIEFKSEQNQPVTDKNRGKAITEINFYNTLNTQLTKRIGFEYDFSISDGIDGVLTIQKGTYRRMILKELKHYSSDLASYQTHKFYYNLMNFGGTSAQKLPHARSFATDLWGFYNGAIQNTHPVPKIYVYPNISTGSARFQVERLTGYSGTEFIFDGADREAKANFMGIGMLNKIEYPTGGSTLYEHEPNSYIYQGTTFLGPGMRIKKMTLKDGSKEEVFDYSYNDSNGQTSGRIIAKPIMARTQSHFTNDQINNLSYYQNNLTQFSDSQAELTSTDNRLIGYKTVTESRPGNGKTVNTYSLNGTLDQSSDIHIDDEGPCSHPHLVGYCDGLFERPQVFHLSYGEHRSHLAAFSLDPPTSDSYPFPPVPNYDWNRGLLLSKEIFNNQGAKLQRTINIYDNYAPGIRHSTKAPYNIYGLAIAEIAVGRPNAFVEPLTGITYRASRYKIITDIAKVISKTIDSVYNYGTGHQPQVNRTDYAYSSRFHTLPTKITTKGSMNIDHVTEFYYPSDLYDDADPETVIFGEMENRNMLSYPIMIRKKVGTESVSETFNKYSLFGNNLIQKQALYEKKGAGINTGLTKDRKVVYNSYDAQGNLLQYTKENGIPVAIVWGYNWKYPVLKIEGATTAQVMAALSTALKEDILDGNISSNSFAGLRNSLPNALITNYTYKTLVGITSITDPKGLTISYEYDSFGRLRNVKDHQGNILTQTEYRYRTQN